MKLILLTCTIMIFLFCINTLVYGQTRCGTPTPESTVEGDSGYRLGGDITIPVFVHVVYASNGTGKVSELEVQDQIDVLDDAFQDNNTDFSFYLAGITWTEDDDWHTCTRGSQDETDMTNALSVDPTHVFNIYITNPGGGYLGWVIKWPWDVSESSKQHGIVIDYGSLPDGSINNFDLGYTAVHEAGHYLGLYHTFQNNCSSPGDEVGDTPYHYANSGCPSPTTNSCPQAGYDPIDNYLNYTYDSCMDDLTSGQNTRMSEIVGEEKPNLGGTTVYFTADYTVPSDREVKFCEGSFKLLLPI